MSKKIINTQSEQYNKCIECIKESFGTDKKGFTRTLNFIWRNRPYWDDDYYGSLSTGLDKFIDQFRKDGFIILGSERYFGIVTQDKLIKAQTIAIERGII